MKECFILRGCPGSGKSTLAKSLTTNINSVICEADMFLYDEDGKYVWSVSRVRNAHIDCMKKFTNALDNGVDRIIVSNTNYREKSVKEYKELAEEHGYLVYVLVIENRHGGVNQHGVSEKKLKHMNNSIKSNMKLI